MWIVMNKDMKWVQKVSVYENNTINQTVKIHAHTRLAD